MTTKDFGIDFGTARVVIYAEGKGVVLDEPAVIAVNANTGKMFACGEEAYAMQGRAPASIEVVRPLAKGVIADFDYACMMLRYFMQKVCAYKVIKPRAAVSVPALVTAVEQRAFMDAVYSAGARQVMLIEESMAAAVGAGLDVEAPRGCMVVEIGAGTTDVAVMSLKGVASSCSRRVGGDAFDEAIMRYIRQKHRLLIGSLSAERLKIEIGKVTDGEEEKCTTVSGRDAVSGLPRVCEITSREILEAVYEPLQEVLHTIQNVLENTPPELSADIYDNGIILTGGMAQLRGMTALVSATTGICCRVADDPMHCVARGAAMSLKYIHMLHSGVYDIGKFLYDGSTTLTN